MPKVQKVSVTHHGHKERPNRKALVVADTPAWAKGLEGREVSFVSAYLRTFNGKQSAIEAGYAASSAHVRAYELLGRQGVQEAVAKALASDFGVSKSSLANELAAIAFANPGDYFSWSEAGGVRLTNSAELTDRQKLAVSEIHDKSSSLKNDDGDEVLVRRDIKVKLADKLGAIEKLAKLLGLQRERPDAQAGGNVFFIIEGPETRAQVIEGEAVEVTPTQTGDAKLVIEGGS